MVLSEGAVTSASVTSDHMLAFPFPMSSVEEGGDSDSCFEEVSGSDDASLLK